MFKPLPEVSSFETRKEWERGAWEALVQQLGEMKNSERKKALELVTSPHERRMITARATALTRLKMRTPYRQIGFELGLTSQTISMLKKALEKDGYESNWKRAKELARIRQLIKWQNKKDSPWPTMLKKTKYGRIRMRY